MPLPVAVRWDPYWVSWARRVYAQSWSVRSLEGVTVRRPICPRCGMTPFVAFIKVRFVCPRCGAHLISDLRTIGVIETVVTVGPLYLAITAIATLWPVGEWSTIRAALILIVPAGAIHWAVLCRYLRITEETQSKVIEIEKGPGSN
ncbi:hypothetical protein [Rhodoferax sp.]|uniref:hypothetical protein n=1 Tax=Rhodoferax sp. TaxID=50421 RepID=UPI0039B8AECD